MPAGNRNTPQKKHIMRQFLIIMAAMVSLSVKAQTGSTARQTAGTAVTAAAAEPADRAAVLPEERQKAAQTLKFGYLSYGEALRAMPEYAEAGRQLGELRAKYDAEARRVETEFNKKYEEFLEGLKDFPQTILQKRQSELQEFLARNIAFKEESARLLAAAERDVYAPLHDRLASILKKIGEERGYAFILNTDNNSCPFVSQAVGEDIGPLVAERL